MQLLPRHHGASEAAVHSRRFHDALLALLCTQAFLGSVQATARTIPLVNTAAIQRLWLIDARNAIMGNYLFRLVTTCVLFHARVQLVGSRSGSLGASNVPLQKVDSWTTSVAADDLLCRHFLLHGNLLDIREYLNAGL